jgi:uncharacterized protein (DUF2336 family)
MIVDAFLEWADQAPQDLRVEAADALARSYLHSPRDDDARRQVMTALFALLDDPSVAVRNRLAEVFADRKDAPRAMVLRLADDVPSVCAPLYARSPLLQTPHLREGLQRGDTAIDVAIAQREDLDAVLVGALLASGGADACSALACNPYVQLSSGDYALYIDRFGDNVAALETLQATRTLGPEQQCLLVSACTKALQSNAFIQALVPVQRLERVACAARERAVLDLLSPMEGADCRRALSAFYQTGGLTPAFALRVALSGQVPVLEAVVACLCDVSMERVRSAFVHARPVVAASLMKKTGLNSSVCCVLSMSLVLARELASAEVDWTADFFCETLIEVIDQRSAQDAFDGITEGAVDTSTLALCHSTAADIMQAAARAQTGAIRSDKQMDLGTLLEAPSSDAREVRLLENAVADALAA